MQYSPAEFMKVHSHLSPGAFFWAVIAQEYSHHQDVSNKSQFTLSAKDLFLIEIQGLHESTSPEKNDAIFLFLAGRTESLLSLEYCLHHQLTNEGYVIVTLSTGRALYWTMGNTPIQSRAHVRPLNVAGHSGYACLDVCGHTVKGRDTLYSISHHLQQTVQK